MKRVAWRLAVICVLLAIALAGIGTKLYHGRFERWFHNYAGGILYEVFWVVLFGALFPKAKAWLIACLVFIVTSGLEFLQLWHPPVLQAIRGNFAGRALIGDGFDRWDFAYYVIGSTVGWILCRAVRSWRQPTQVPEA